MKKLSQRQGNGDIVLQADFDKENGGFVEVSLAEAAPKEQGGPGPKLPPMHWFIEGSDHFDEIIMASLSFMTWVLKMKWQIPDPFQGLHIMQPFAMATAKFVETVQPDADKYKYYFAYALNDEGTKGWVLLLAHRKEEVGEQSKEKKEQIPVSATPAPQKDPKDMTLEEKLQQAVKEERYEDAAKIKKEINELNKILTTKTQRLIRKTIVQAFKVPEKSDAVEEVARYWESAGGKGGKDFGKYYRQLKRKKRKK